MNWQLPSFLVIHRLISDPTSPGTLIDSRKLTQTQSGSRHVAYWLLVELELLWIVDWAWIMAWAVDVWLKFETRFRILVKTTHGTLDENFFCNFVFNWPVWIQMTYVVPNSWLSMFRWDFCQSFCIQRTMKCQKRINFKYGSFWLTLLFNRGRGNGSNKLTAHGTFGHLPSQCS